MSRRREAEVNASAEIVPAILKTFGVVLLRRSSALVIRRDSAATPAPGREQHGGRELQRRGQVGVRVFIAPE